MDMYSEGTKKEIKEAINGILFELEKETQCSLYLLEKVSTIERKIHNREIELQCPKCKSIVPVLHAFKYDFTECLECMVKSMKTRKEEEEEKQY